MRSLQSRRMEQRQPSTAFCQKLTWRKRANHQLLHRNLSGTGTGTVTASAFGSGLRSIDFRRHPEIPFGCTGLSRKKSGEFWFTGIDYQYQPQQSNSPKRTYFEPIRGTLTFRKINCLCGHNSDTESRYYCSFS